MKVETVKDRETLNKLCVCVLKREDEAKLREKQIEIETNRNKY